MMESRTIDFSPITTPGKMMELVTVPLMSHPSEM